ncbi:hypothetical protein AVEN_42600-1 [Araneus ventricosus]|uniref:Uncharacterized protein n=1 Tax=Araneus ventricosus TaxID=182803 RepID=A0A4Y2JUE7_ARAVE|nr:hypothetical protein AVEN_42600-1 [Araneus ventricosus]
MEGVQMDWNRSMVNVLLKKIGDAFWTSSFRPVASKNQTPNVIDFTPAALAFFDSVSPGEQRGFRRIRTVPAVIVVYQWGSEFPLSLKEELGVTVF